MERTEFVHFYQTEDNRKGCAYNYDTVPDDASISHPTHITKEELETIKNWVIERAMAIIYNHI